MRYVPLVLGAVSIAMSVWLHINVATVHNNSPITAELSIEKPQNEKLQYPVLPAQLMRAAETLSAGDVSIGQTVYLRHLHVCADGRVAVNDYYTAWLSYDSYNPIKATRTDEGFEIDLSKRPGKFEIDTPCKADIMIPVTKLTGVAR